ncbi:unnamed protein product [Gongylonema pulchrum]|uniref:Stimulator of interferon genes protein n=1 Tax=Gongylonema pulchrum TaxID=637853 RepID=A0A183EQC2_9BILA|nr:unnamed protein product [Gongylonema pulchrum]
MQEKLPVFKYDGDHHQLDMYGPRRPVLYILLSEIIIIQKALRSNLEKVIPEKKSQLRDLIEKTMPLVVESTESILYKKLYLHPFYCADDDRSDDAEILFQRLIQSLVIPEKKSQLRDLIEKTMPLVAESTESIPYKKLYLHPFYCADDDRSDDAEILFQRTKRSVEKCLLSGCSGKDLSLLLAHQTFQEEEDNFQKLPHQSHDQ